MENYIRFIFKYILFTWTRLRIYIILLTTFTDCAKIMVNMSNIILNSPDKNTNYFQNLYPYRGYIKYQAGSKQAPHSALLAATIIKFK